MIRWRLIVLAALTATAFAGCLTFFVAQLARIDANRRFPPPPASMPTLTGQGGPLAADTIQRPTAEQEAAAAFERAAKTILKRLPETLAYAGADEPPITRHIPLPKRRPIPRDRSVLVKVEERPEHGQRESRRSQVSKRR
jgi:hypothetical protein